MIVWDIDDTLILTNASPKPAKIDIDIGYLNPLVIGREHEVTHLITGRFYAYRRETEHLLRHFNIPFERIWLNPEDDYSQVWIAKIKSRYLDDANAEYYVEDNPKYRKVMAEFWDGECISVKQWSRLGEI